jgi:acetyl-CoA decarbonylase/synthase complex subunit gamma
VSLPRLEQPFVIGSIETLAGNIPQVSSRLSALDIWGTFKARWGVGRMDYAIDPGLYALGHPTGASPVMVTANYKMSFDRLRESILDRNVWILVLDTKGINVWCAAGKGTFGTNELVARIKSSALDRVVSHRQLILPQLAGPGVAAHQVKKLSGYKVIYGPIRSRDLLAFMDGGNTATYPMRIKSFDTWERIVLIPVELISALKAAVLILPAFFLLGGFSETGWYWKNCLNAGLFAALAVLSSIFAGAVLMPALLPWLPGKAFSVKGLAVGLLTALGLIFYRSHLSGSGFIQLETVAWLFLIPSLSSYLAMNFTGASTYTSLSGVKKEMRWAVPFQIGTALIGLGLWLIARFLI